MSLRYSFTRLVAQMNESRLVSGGAGIVSAGGKGVVPRESSGFGRRAVESAGGLGASPGVGVPPAGAGGPPDTGDAPAPPDTTADAAQKLPPVDSVAKKPEPVDTSQISFIWATSRVKLYRDDMQMSCDSLVYYDLDSLVRMYRDPLVFSDGNRQYAADSIYLVIKDRKADRARLMSNAFITTKEDTLCYDQIKGAEMMAYFDTTRTLRRFDALGGATALFFLTENNALATVNKVESKMLYALFDQGNLDKIYYFDNAKNDAYPVVQLPAEERYMKGFRWEPERQPRSGADITPLKPRRSQRTSYLARPHAAFKETDVYFPGHIKQIYKDIAYRDSMAVIKARQPKEAPPAPDAPIDTTALSAPLDTTALVPLIDTTAILPPVDTPAVLPPIDTTAIAPLDSVAVKPAVENVPDESEENPEENPEEISEPKPEEPVLDPAALKKAQEQAAKEAEKARKAEEKAAREAEKARIAAEKRAAKEAKWAEEDKKYQEKQAKKEEKRLEKERKKKLRIMTQLEKKAQKERRIFERYLEQERQRAEKQAAQDAEKAARQNEKAARKAGKDEQPKQPIN